MGWKTETWDFVALSNATPLEFSSLGSSDSGAYGLALDDVRVLPIPESSTGFLVACGLALLQLAQPTARRAQAALKVP
jgi:hypothetical protein